MKKIVVIISIIFLCLSSTALSKVFHIPENNLYILVHPVEPAKKDKIPEPPQDPKDNNYYELLGFEIPSALKYNLNSHIPLKFISPIMNSFSRWQDVTYDPIFTAPLYDQTEKNWYQNDGENVISFVKFTPRDYIAFTAIYYNPETMYIVDADIVLNALHKWDVGASKAFDVQNIMTHEIGHVVGLADLYLEIHSELTMYGYGRKGEVKKRTLENGDILGAQSLYGEVY